METIEALELNGLPCVNKVLLYFTSKDTGVTKAAVPIINVEKSNTLLNIGVEQKLN